MTKTYTYGVSGSTAYLPNTDEIEEFTDKEIEYTATNVELNIALATIIRKEYFNNSILHQYPISIDLGLQAFIDDNDLTEKLCEIYDEQLHEYFKESALRYC